MVLGDIEYQSPTNIIMLVQNLLEGISHLKLCVDSLATDYDRQVFCMEKMTEIDAICLWDIRRRRMTMRVINIEHYSFWFSKRNPLSKIRITTLNYLL
jgi:hypothetical protein